MVVSAFACLTLYYDVSIFTLKADLSLDLVISSDPQVQMVSL